MVQQNKARKKSIVINQLKKQKTVKKKKNDEDDVVIQKNPFEKFNQFKGNPLLEKLAMEIKQIRYDIQRNVLADSSQVHQAITVFSGSFFELRNYHYLQKYQNTVTLMKGYPHYCKFVVDIERFFESSYMQFPLIFKIQITER